MKPYLYIIILSLTIPGSISYAQNTGIAQKDSSISFTVFGACEQCKERIEKVVKGKGVKSASWNVDTKKLSLVYNTLQVSLDKIQNRIVAVGHDLESKKAKDPVYNALPACCHYREMETMLTEIKADAILSKQPDKIAARHDSSATPVSSELYPGLHLIQGLVVEADTKGEFNPLPNASVYWLGTNTGVLTDSAGVFKIKHTGFNSRLVINYIGYQSDTITISDLNTLKIIMASNRQLKEVTVTNRQRASYISTLSAIRTEVMTAKELLKAACCNLSESFETNPSVDVSYNDAVTGSKQIQLLGLSGN